MADGAAKVRDADGADGVGEAFCWHTRATDRARGTTFRSSDRIFCELFFARESRRWLWFSVACV